MRTEIHINSGTQNGPIITFPIGEKLNTKILIPSGKMITDSEKMTFVYLLDEEEEYGQLHFEQAVWPLLVDSLKLNTNPVVTFDENAVSLNGFIEELTMLIYNIEGNNNYGEAFSTAVESAFEEILKSTI
ncbi:hypothetical protein JSQ81_18140 [Sporosarcina sp. Marseille-Q4063]|uniref:UPF0738 family protein n=1 Tax=Sporosarcina sp. Marseille-Q4063 TaxID=2810514 RepID=UPI001BAF4C00|nr:hypothetical protein [Sporosarcina sp. Marseille-Q4063]QUW21679.1 hypothetical protein JSQ81_18140 [Sporosarcina sp. Marseille-Q4063]